MKIVTYTVGNGPRMGFFNSTGEWVYPLSAAGMDYKDMKTLVKEICGPEIQMAEYVAGKSPYEIPGAAQLGEVKLLAPIPVPEQDIICLGVNYMAHAEEAARFNLQDYDGTRPHAIYFSKRVNEAVGDGGEIDGHFDIVDSLDYEAELAVIIGKDAKDVPAEKAREYVFGYTIINDVSARNIQDRHSQWYFGKSLDTFTPMGPCIVTANEIAYPPKLKIQSRVNGELRQDSNTELLIFGIDHIISELSRGMTLKAGTIISTGTPSGVGIGFTPPVFLKSGDEVECIVEGIGSIKNRVK